MKAAAIVEAIGVGTRFGRSNWGASRTGSEGRRGDVLAMVGGSGSGKTTLLRHINGLTRPTEGAYRRIRQRALFGRPAGGPQPAPALRHAVSTGRAVLGADGLSEHRLPLRELRLLDEAMIRDLVLLKLAQVELRPSDARLLPSELSGGMVKRVALARALALEPELLLLDEPTAGLDPDRSESFVRLIRQLRAELGLTVVLVTHDLDTLAALATCVAVLAERRILATGSLAQVMQVDHPFIRGFFGSERSRIAIERGRALG
jgi:phospholipid/cholesterol/gamma-HCH transport system ATP-binding protein